MSRILNASSSSVTPMFRRDQHGEIISVIPERDEYVTPPKGTQVRLLISGISDTFELPDFNDPEKLVKKVRVEFEIMGGQGNWPKINVGKRFTQIFSLTIGPKSKLGALFSGLLERPISPGEDLDIDAFIGASFVATTTTTPKGYGEVILDSILPGRTQLPAWLQKQQPAIDDDPFGIDEEPDF